MTDIVNSSVMSTFVFVMLGTGGDVLPGIAIAAELQNRGHSVTVLSYEYFESYARKENLQFVSIGSTESYLGQVTQESFWERYGTSKGLDNGGYLNLAIRPVYDYIVGIKSCRPNIVCTRNAYGARFAAEIFDLPIICMAYSSTQFVSATRFPYSAPFLRKLPLPIRYVSTVLGDRLYNQPLLKKLNPLRASVGLGPIKNLRRWSYFSTPSLALYPSWYDDVSNLKKHGVRQVGFVFAHANEKSVLPPDIIDFLDSGKPPIVFTFGTGIAHVKNVFERCLSALDTLGERGIFVTGFAKNLPNDTAGVLVAPYADFSALLPKTKLLVHHGGIGTAAQAIRAGIPQLIIPLAFDQPDNAYRLASLSLAGFLPGQDASVKDIVDGVQKTLANTSLIHLSRLSAELQRNDGRSLAADHCELYFQRF